MSFEISVQSAVTFYALDASAQTIKSETTRADEKPPRTKSLIRTRLLQSRSRKRWANHRRIPLNNSVEPNNDHINYTPSSALGNNICLLLFRSFVLPPREVPAVKAELELSLIETQKGFPNWKGRYVTG